MKALLISILIIQQVVIMLLVFYMKKQTGELNTFKYKHARYFCTAALLPSIAITKALHHYHEP